jgi:hypothetical protein
MFVLCPHCQFLVAIDPASGQPPQRCTRCRKLLAPPVDAEAEEAPAQDVAQVATPGPVADDDAGTTATVVDAAGAASPLEAAIEAVVDEVATVEPEVAPEASLTPDPIPAPVPAPAATRGRTRARVAPSAPAAAPTPPRSRTRAKPRNRTRASAPTPTPAPDPAPAAAPPASASAPGFVHRQRARIARTSNTQRWMIAAIVVLSLLLVLQLLLADRDNLARDARWRPAMSSLCSVLRCTLPTWREPTAFTLLDRDVRPRPGMPGVLHVTATFRNDARWPQAWPALLLTLSDVDGRAAGARVFAPREYLGAVPVQATLASGQSAMLSLDVVEPAPRIVAFTFDFR